VGSVERGLVLQPVGGRGCWWAGLVGYVPCFRDFDVGYVCMGGGVGGASGEKFVRSCWRKVGICGVVWWVCGRVLEWR
jgi:hypothetical protein